MKILRAEEFDVPIISIGNLSAGGTGKTPHTEYLIRLLQQEYRMAVLSRGYKRKSSGFILANNQATADTIGDESYQLFCKFPGIQVTVDANRRRGIKNLLNLPEEIRPEVILLDDAYQHRYVKPSLSILLTEYSRPFSRDRLLPAGRLREPVKSKNRADILIVTKSPSLSNNESLDELAKELSLIPSQKLFCSAFSYGNLQAVFPGNPEIGLSKQEIDSAVLFSGIASPQPLIDYLKGYIPYLQIHLFPDHHAYNRVDFDFLLSLFQKVKDTKKILITTEKDKAKLINDPDFPEELKQHLYYLPIEVTFLQQEIFNKTISDHVTAVRRNH